MSVGFIDHFSLRSAAYARARPGYPPELFSALSALAPAANMAWDVGTGNGQAAVALAAHFGEVLATDASVAQLAEARPHPRVRYRVGRESNSELPDRSVDLVTVAQALHWFDLQSFYREALRVLRPGGILAVWCYGLCRITPKIDVRIGQFYSATLGAYWHPARRHVDSGYHELGFPLADLPFPAVRMERHWTLDDLLAYLRTWSAAAAYQKAHGVDPVTGLAAELAGRWGSPDATRTVIWPLTGRLGRVPR